MRKKLEILADAAKYDASCASSGGKRKSSPVGLGSVEGMGICHSYTPDGRCVSLLNEEDLRRVVDTLRALLVTTGR